MKSILKPAIDNRQRRIKTLFTGVLILLVLSFTSVSVFAVPGVDASRIKLSISKSDLDLRFGSVRLRGHAKLVKPFTDAELENLEKEAMKKAGITQLEIQEANKLVEKARKATEFTQEDVERVKQNIFTSMNTLPGMGSIPSGGDVSAFLDFINKTMNSSSWDDIGTASVDLGENGMNEKVKETAKGMFDAYGDIGEEFVKKYEWVEQLSSIAQFAEMIDAEHMRDKQKWHDIAQGADAKRKLNNFYDTLQTLVSNYMETSNERGWVIQFDNATFKRNFYFYGTKNDQTWTLDMVLKQQVTDELGSIAGIYEGDFFLKSTHNMQGLVKDLDIAARKMEPIKEMLNAFKQYPEITPSLSTNGGGSALIDRIITGHCTAEIRKDGTATIDMSTKNDDKQIAFTDMQVDLNLLVSNKELGDLVKLAFPLNVLNESDKIQIQAIKLNVADLSSDVNIQETFESNKALTDVNWDPSMWEPWDLNDKSLYLFK